MYEGIQSLSRWWMVQMACQQLTPGHKALMGKESFLRAKNQKNICQQKITMVFIFKEFTTRTTCFPMLTDEENNGIKRVKEDNGIWQDSMEKKKPSWWVAINSPAKESPLSKHFTYHYVNLIRKCGWVGLLRRNAALCVCMFCGSSDQSETHNSHPLNLFFLSSNRPAWQPQAQQLNWNRVVPLIRWDIISIKQKKEKNATQLSLAKESYIKAFHLISGSFNHLRKQQSELAVQWWSKGPLAHAESMTYPRMFKQPYLFQID